MKTEQKKWTKETGWATLSDQKLESTAGLVLVFGGKNVIQEVSHFDEIRRWYPSAHIVLASTAGEIINTQVNDDSLAVTAVQFEKSALQVAKASIREPNQSRACGETLAAALPHEGLVHVMVFSDGQLVNGTALVAGLTHVLPGTVSVTGGLVGSGYDFKETYVGLDEVPASGNIVLIGFYGTSLKVGYGSLGGWDPFGPERVITKSKDNVLYELDGKPALALYKEYLGEKAKELPSSGLLFPLSVRFKTDKADVEVVRTLLAVDEASQSMTFAGDMLEGAYAKLMKANFDRIIDGASSAASASRDGLGATDPELAVLISCVGRKLVLKGRVEEEIESVREVVGKAAAITGFYSYGEICPTAPTEKQCQLHNQTMTITTFREV
ncbi:hypothetical protein A3A63_02225 [Candidatus Gottesmanbacteria bacterium RIFCSPLOWO2_01_FULL_46_9]|uniref:FIST C-domain domain-containing protein n=1 Tax=Candidatus Gottesmanbacteria bacterium RIFCSPLOWO2_01_FULL_46_9 TaxID=1798394 RepID=A0A1F6B364_9BACT|nr:MAG: hypothetical protein A3A63_02225 [Candidatus Gottesmanbacteria bacterium RIFCSPLOWO2_01_FULL_46_9]